jgi:hypothetical protein
MGLLRIILASGAIICKKILACFCQEIFLRFSFAVEQACATQQLYLQQPNISNLGEDWPLPAAANLTHKVIGKGGDKQPGLLRRGIPLCRGGSSLLYLSLTRARFAQQSFMRCLLAAVEKPARGLQPEMVLHREGPAGQPRKFQRPFGGSPLAVLQRLKPP